MQLEASRDDYLEIGLNSPSLAMKGLLLDECLSIIKENIFEQLPSSAPVIYGGFLLLDGWVTLPLWTLGLGDR